MAFSVIFYNTAKKVNSTKIPTNSVGTVSAELKEQCSILNPVLKIKNIDFGTTSANYCFISKFNRYYSITNITWDNAFWLVELKIDVLASYKSAIGGHTLFVERAFADENLAVVDNTYPTLATAAYQKVVKSTPWSATSISDGTIVVGVVGIQTTYYAMTPTFADTFFTYLLGSNYANDLAGNWASVYGDLTFQANPLQFISSIMWYPFSSTIGTAVANVRVGWVDVPVSYGARKIGTQSIHEFTTTFDSIPEHPQILRGNYLKISPYSSYDLFFPPFGFIQLDSLFVANAIGEINAVAHVDMRTGEATLTISNYGKSMIHSWLTAKVGVNYQVSQVINQTKLSLMSSLELAGDTAFGAATGGLTGAIVGAAKGTLGLIGTAAKSKIPVARSVGTTGSLCTLLGNPTLQCEFKLLVDEDKTNRGRPLCEMRQISTLSGYILVSDANIEIAAEQAELEEIKNYMEGGFFYE